MTLSKEYDCRQNFDWYGYELWWRFGRYEDILFQYKESIYSYIFQYSSYRAFHFKSNRNKLFSVKLDAKLWEINELDCFRFSLQAASLDLLRFHWFIKSKVTVLSLKNEILI